MAALAWAMLWFPIEIGVGLSGDLTCAPPLLELLNNNDDGFADSDRRAHDKACDTLSGRRAIAAFMVGVPGLLLAVAGKASADRERDRRDTDRALGRHRRESAAPPESFG